MNGAAIRSGARELPASRSPRGYWKLAAIVAVCVAPVIASYLAYYVFPPGGRTNYGELVEPQRDVSRVALAPLGDEPRSFGDGARSPGDGPRSLGDLAGKWLLVTFASGACDAECAARLWTIRQVRLTTGAERDRVERLLLVTDGSTPPADLLAAHEGLRLARIAPADAARAFPAGAQGPIDGRIWVVDPRGNLMMSFPVGADPARMKKDLVRLLRASRIG